MPFKANANFRKPGNVSLSFYAYKKDLTVRTSQHASVKQPHPWAGRDAVTRIADDAALRSAFVALCEEAEQDGWTEYGNPGTWRERTGPTAPRRPTAKETEARLEAISAELGAALDAAGGKRAAEKRALDAALKAYGDLNESLDRNRLDFAIPFFSLDGIGLKKKRVPALLRPGADPETLARWSELLEAAAR
jgi:hypothetical protein